MEACFVLPDGYEERCRIDLQKDRGLSLLVNGLALVVFIVGGIIGHRFVPVHIFYSMSEGMLLYFIRLAAMFGGAVLYIFLHEFVNGIFIKYYSGRKAKYGFTGLYAYAEARPILIKSSILLLPLRL